ncbi:AGE family epimerase/isomerase [Hyphococcus sp. DH-69]|uniref:AGE family epimerase/isomerase n=1 Tax=Hyphococcus formosus TaxID=3143534 RepID=UPI00398AF88D
MKSLEQSTQRLLTWFCTDVLPLWIQNGYNDHDGGFYEALNFDGSPITNRPRRVRTQARQIHSFTQAALRNWGDGAEDLAAKGFSYFVDKACPDMAKRGCLHLIADDGTIIDDHRDLYDQAFLLLACASRYQATKDAQAKELADNTINFMDAELGSADGGWLESCQFELPRRQNPHMHLFEAFTALFNATHDERYLEYADKVYNLFRTRFYDNDHHVIREFFDNEWRLVEAAEIIEPGHMLEWVSLLSAYDKCRGTNNTELSTALYEAAIEIGCDSNFFQFVDNKSKIDAPDEHSAKRLWPQTEFLRASLIMGGNGDEKAEDRAAKIIDGFFDTYFDVDKTGLWNDEFDAAGKPISKDVPASILYHIIEAVIAVDDYRTKGTTP